MFKTVEECLAKYKKECSNYLKLTTSLEESESKRWMTRINGMQAVLGIIEKENDEILSELEKQL